MAVAANPGLDIAKFRGKTGNGSSLPHGWIFEVSGRSFQGRFFAGPPAWVELTKKQFIETKAVESLKPHGSDVRKRR
jgi:hypothetical protein